MVCSWFVRDGCGWGVVRLLIFESFGLCGMKGRARGELDTN